MCCTLLNFRDTWFVFVYRICRRPIKGCTQIDQTFRIDFDIFHELCTRIPFETVANSIAVAATVTITTIIAIAIASGLKGLEQPFRLAIDLGSPTSQLEYRGSIAL